MSRTRRAVGGAGCGPTGASPHDAGAGARPVRCGQRRSSRRRRRPACLLDRGGRIIVANRALEELLAAATAGGLPGRGLPSLAYPPDEQLARAAVQTICHFTRCAMGQVWLPAGNLLVCSPTWYCSGYGFEKLHAASEEASYKLGQGLPGRRRAVGPRQRPGHPGRAPGAGVRGLRVPGGPLDQRGHRHGLAICGRIVEVMGGGVGVKGDHGTDVRSFLPAAVDARWPARDLTAGAAR